MLNGGPNAEGQLQQEIEADVLTCQPSSLAGQKC